MHIESPAFEANQSIPKKFTCDGEDLSPPLNIQNVPKDTKSLVLIVEDPDAPRGTFVHWLAWNIDPSSSQLSEGAAVPSQGRNDFGELDYRGPCPPKGEHRYFFKLYALDTKLELPSGSNKKELEEVMEGHVIGKAELMGLYQR